MESSKTQYVSPLAFNLRKAISQAINEMHATGEMLTAQILSQPSERLKQIDPDLHAALSEVLKAVQASKSCIPKDAEVITLDMVQKAYRCVQ